MDKRHQEEFAQGLIILAQMFEKLLPPTLIDRYFAALEDLPWEKVQQAIHLAEKSLKFFPKPVELRELIEGSPDDQAERAWAAYSEAVRRIGAYTSLQVEDGALAETILRVFSSWPEACRLPLRGPEHGAKRREFLETYRQVRQLPPQDLPHELAGLFEQDNLARAGSITQGHVPPLRTVGMVAKDGRVWKEDVPQLAALQPMTAPVVEAVAGGNGRGPKALEGDVEEQG